jgi:DnaJ-class molecular chaperone
MAVPSQGKKDLYKALGIERSANQNEIKKAYFQLARVHHPDKGGDSETFKEIQRAYEVLTNTQSRQIYDMTGQIPGELGGQDVGSASSGGGGGFFPFGMPGSGQGSGFAFNLDELFGMFSPGGNGGGGGGGRSVRRMGKPPPKIQNMKLGLKHFYYGQNFNINLDRQKICRQCDGTGAAKKDACSDCRGSGSKSQVIQMGGMIMESRGPCSSCQGKGWHISGKCSECSGIGKKEEKIHQMFSLQPGMKSGESVVLTEVCSEMPEFERSGDLHVIFELDRESSSSLWQRQGQAEEHLVYVLQISLAESLLGLTVKLSGHPGYSDGLWVRLSGCLLTGDTYCLNDLGMPIMGQMGKYGNGYIQIIVKPTAEERKTLLGQGRTGNIEVIFGEHCRKYDGDADEKEAEIFTDAYLCDSVPNLR